MALYKERELNNGITVRYHRIIGFNKRPGCLVVTVGCYVSDAYRQKETQDYDFQIKKYVENRDKMVEILSKQEISNAEQAEYDTAFASNLEYGKMLISASSPFMGSVSTEMYIVPITGDDISYRDIYKELKKDPTFIGATDC